MSTTTVLLRGPSLDPNSINFHLMLFATTKFLSSEKFDVVTAVTASYLLPYPSLSGLDWRSAVSTFVGAVDDHFVCPSIQLDAFIDNEDVKILSRRTRKPIQFASLPPKIVNGTQSGYHSPSVKKVRLRVTTKTEKVRPKLP